MSLILFSFTVNMDSKEAVFAGNVEPQVALTILQDIVIMDAVGKAKKQETQEAKVPEE